MYSVIGKVVSEPCWLRPARDECARRPESSVAGYRFAGSVAYVVQVVPRDRSTRVEVRGRGQGVSGGGSGVVGRCVRRSCRNGPEPSAESTVAPFRKLRSSQKCCKGAAAPF